MTKTTKIVAIAAISLIGAIILVWLFLSQRNIHQRLVTKENAAEDKVVMVDYDLPEAGIKFRLTPDTKTDMQERFTGKDEEGATEGADRVDLFSAEEMSQSKCSPENKAKLCVLGKIYFIYQTDLSGHDPCLKLDSWKVAESKVGVTCVSNDFREVLADKIMTDQEYRQFFKVGNSQDMKIFGFDFNKVEAIEDYSNQCPSNYGYKESCKLYWKFEIENRDDLLFFGYAVSGESLSYGYMKYKGAIYHWHTGRQSAPAMVKMEADPVTFQVIDGEMDGAFVEWAYGRDASKVFVVSSEVKGADPKTFQLIKDDGGFTDYFKDNKNIYYGARLVKEADWKTFKVIKVNDQYLGQDKKHCFLGAAVIENNRCNEKLSKGENNDPTKWKKYENHEKRISFYHPDIYVIKEEPQAIHFYHQDCAHLAELPRRHCINMNIDVAKTPKDITDLDMLVEKKKTLSYPFALADNYQKEKIGSNDFLVSEFFHDYGDRFAVNFITMSEETYYVIKFGGQSNVIGENELKTIREIIKRFEILKK